ncbi:MAG: CBS domain-containing protein [Candidatus Jordarchaeum sp.]|uniref:CBS domain-containing protein n=1 Tax=Candidatus Jordarchaeum sp. TaxID=2823881 RepID=UPI00404B9649
MNDIARPNVITCKVTDDVPTVAKKMVDAEVGSIFVEDLNGKIIGLITDGQVFRLVADREDPNRKTARDIMVTPIHKVEKDASLKEAWEIFQKTGYKRLAVTDGDKIVGVLSRKILQRFMRYTRAKLLLR